MNDLYKHRQLLDASCSLTEQVDHTMESSLAKYVHQKIPASHIENGIRKGLTIEVHGVYPRHLKVVSRSIGVKELKKITFKKKNKSPSLNDLRPQFYHAVTHANEKILLSCVPPGRDYLLHYGSMIGFVMAKYKHRVVAQPSMKIFSYPRAERTIHSWSGLGRKFVKSGDIVVFGYVKDLEAQMSRVQFFQKISSFENQYYSSIRYEVVGGLVVNLLAAKFSYWGDMSSKLVTRCCSLGASQILHIGKAGALTKPGDIYKKIYCPSRYILMINKVVKDDIQTLKNPLLKVFPELDSNAHVSVPTVLEETYEQRLIASKLGAKSIDIESSQMAKAVSEYNQKYRTNIQFGGIYFATDYLRKSREAKLGIKFDMSNSRHKIAKKLKQKIVARICRKLVRYLANS